MKLRIRLSEKAPFVCLVGLIAGASVAFAYAEDQRIAEAVRLQSAVNGKHASARSEYEFWPVLILLGGLGLALLVFAAFYSLWRAQQQAELASTEQRLSLARSKQRLRSLFDNAGDGICGLNARGEIIFANPTAGAILGASTDDLMGQMFADFLRPRDTACEPSRASCFANQNDALLTTADCKELVIDLTTTPLRDHSGASSGSVIIFRDITARVQAENALRDANAELEEFAYRTSHDLRSPLVSSLALLKAVSRQLDATNPAPARKGLSLSIRALEDLERLVEDIQQLSRTKAELEDDAPIDFATLTEGALERHTYLDGYDKLTVTTDFRAPAEFSSKPRRVDLIVNNLVSNAIKYHDPVEPEPAIRISTYPGENSILLVVEDNGLGIPVEQRANVFAMFKRFHPRVAFGSGLGLYMVRKSAEKIGAHVAYEPLAKGSRFIVTFPLPTTLKQAA